MNRSMRLIRVITTGLLLVLVTACAHTPHDTDAAAGAESHSGSWYDAVIGFYRGPLNHLSAVRRGVCPMHPSCSEYSRQAVARHGFVVGWAMTMDRLLRCGRDEVDRSPRIWADGQWKVYDPVDRNDFWWSDADLESPQAKLATAAAALSSAPTAD